MGNTYVAKNLKKKTARIDSNGNVVERSVEMTGAGEVADDEDIGNEEEDEE